MKSRNCIFLPNAFLILWWLVCTSKLSLQPVLFKTYESNGLPLGSLNCKYWSESTIWVNFTLSLLDMNNTLFPWCAHGLMVTIGLRWEGTSGGHLVHLPCTSRAIYSWLPKTKSRFLLDISKDGDSTACLDNLSYVCIKFSNNSKENFVYMVLAGTGYKPMYF